MYDLDMGGIEGQAKTSILLEHVEFIESHKLQELKQ